MSDNLNIQQPNAASQLASYAAFPVSMQGISGINAIARHKGIKNALKAQNHTGFKNLAQAIDKDVFSRSIQLSGEYDAYKTLANKNAKWSKKAAKAAKKGDLPLLDKFKNLFRKDKLTLEVIEKNADDAAKALSKADDALKSGKSVLKATGKEVAKEISEEGFKTTAKNLIKTELKSKINIAFAGLFTFWPTFKENAIPAFKNDGIIAGLKETAKALGFGAMDLGGSAIATAIGGAIGGTIGTFFCPGAGTNIGRAIGSAVSSMFVSCKVADAAKKAGKYTKNEQENNQTTLNLEA